MSLSRSMQRHLPPPSLEAVNAALDGYDEAMLLVWKQPHTRDMPLYAVGRLRARLRPGTTARERPRPARPGGGTGARALNKFLVNPRGLAADRHAEKGGEVLKTR